MGEVKGRVVENAGSPQSNSLLYKVPNENKSFIILNFSRGIVNREAGIEIFSFEGSKAESKRAVTPLVLKTSRLGIHR